MVDVDELRKRHVKLIGGIAIENRKRLGNGGTLACIVFDKDTGEPLGLSNRHILTKRIGSLVIQPNGKKRTKKYVVGSVYKKGGRGDINDFAVFKLRSENRDYDKENSIYGLDGLITDFVDPVEGMKVQKVGKRTGLTFGIIGKKRDSVRYTILPNLEKNEPGQEISEGGDSGALWVTDDNKKIRAVALHNAGEGDDSSKDEAYAIPIRRVLEKLNVRFWNSDE